jgi:hypothetical protein
MGAGKTSTSQTTKTEIPAEIRERGTTISNAAMKTYFDPSKKYEPYKYNKYAQVGKDTTAQLNSYHTQAGAGYTDAKTNYQPYIDRADTAATGAYTANNADQVDGPNFTQANVERFMNPFSSLVIDQGLSDISRGLNTQRLENQSRAAGAGAFGGARHGVVDAESQRTAADTAQRFVGEQLNTGYDKAVNQYNTDYGQGLQATTLNNAAKAQNFSQGTAYSDLLAKLGLQTQQQGLAAADGLLKFGNTKMAQEQAQKDNAYEKGYQDKRNYPMDIYERLAGINAMQPVNRTSTSTGTQSQSGGWIGPAIGAAGTIIASDERAKESIEDVDPETVLGAFAQVTPKSYTYKREARETLPELTKPGRRTGFMAQDMERAFGRPSGPEVKGIKTVDLGEVMGNLVAAVHGLERRTRALKRG